MDIIEEIYLALKHLKNQQILVSIAKGERTLFFMKNSTIKVIGTHGRYSLSIDDFLVLFEKELFYLLEQQQEEKEFLLQKDEEYYSWKHK